MLTLNVNEFTSLEYSQANQSNNWCSTTLDISELFLSTPVQSSLHDTLLYSRDATNSSFDDFAEFDISDVTDQIFLFSHCAMIIAGAHLEYF